MALKGSEIDIVIIILYNFNWFLDVE